jgi:hypothetical protein
MFQYLKTYRFIHSYIREDDNSSKKHQQPARYLTFTMNYATVSFFYYKQRNVGVYVFIYSYGTRIESALRREKKETITIKNY